MSLDMIIAEIAAAHAADDDVAGCIPATCRSVCDGEQLRRRAR